MLIPLSSINAIEITNTFIPNNTHRACLSLPYKDDQHTPPHRTNN